MYLYFIITIVPIRKYSILLAEALKSNIKIVSLVLDEVSFKKGD